MRPCIVAGPKARALADTMPCNQLPRVIRTAARALPVLKVPLPDPGTPLQLLHHDDVVAAIAPAATTSAPAGAYNIANDEAAAAWGAQPGHPPSAETVSDTDVTLGGDFADALRAGRT
jgi:nucleoside-diphosphate-sugar epimerase